MVSFRHSGGHPVLLLSRGEIPDLLNAHYVLSTSERLERRAQFKISSRDLSPGTYFVAVNNMNYYAYSACEYVVAIESSLANEYAMTSPGFMTVILVVIMGAFVCMALSVCRRLFARAMRRRGAPGGVLFGGRDEDWGDVAMAGDARRRSAPRGCPRAVVDAIPRVVFGSEEWDSGKWSVEDESCSVCIDAFERGETLLCLPECQHAFHKDCIEGWLAQNTTCPNCRASLVSAEGGGRRGSARGRGGAAPASPPGVVEGAPTSSDFDRIADEAREEARRGRRGGAPLLEASERPRRSRPSRCDDRRRHVDYHSARDANFVTSVPDVHTTLLSITHTCGYVAPFSGSYGGVSAFPRRRWRARRAWRRRSPPPRSGRCTWPSRRPASLPSPGAP